MKKRVTIKDVAALANVSYQTVSRVINNSSRVSEETRLRVEAAIARLNYRPSLAARSLPGRLSYVIGFIIPYNADYLIRDPNLLAQISGTDAVAHERGYNLLLSMAGNGRSGLEAYQRFMQNHVADGALVVETISSNQGNPLLARDNYPFVMLGYNLGNSAVYSVHSDDYGGVKAATIHLLEQGHKRIGIINGPAQEGVAALTLRLSGHKAALREAGLEVDPNLVTRGDFTRASGEAATHTLMALPNPPTAIFAFNDRMAMGAIHALNKIGRSVPHEVAVVGFDDIPAAADFHPPLTTVKQHSKEIGQKAAELLFRLIDGETVKEREITLATTLIVRQSS